MPRHKTPARGYRCRNGHRQVVVRFDDETFEDIRKRADKAKRSFTEQVRCLVEWGLEVDEEDWGWP